MIMLHLIWSHQNVFHQHYLQILSSDSNVHASAWLHRMTVWIFSQPVLANLDIPAQEQVGLVLQAADGLGLAEACNFSMQGSSSLSRSIHGSCHVTHENIYITYVLGKLVPQPEN